MKVKQPQQQVRLWALLGPFMMLLIFAAYQFRISPGQFYLPLVAVFGMILCWQGRTKGLITALFILLGTLFYTLTYAPMEEKYWYIGVTMATALSFVVTSFSLEELEQVLSKATKDGESRLLYISQLDEGKRNKEKKWKEERDKLIVDLDWEKERYKELEEELASLKKLTEKYQSEATIDSYKPLYQQLRVQFEEKGELLHETRKELFVAKEQLATFKKEMEEATVFDQNQTVHSLESEIATMGKEMDYWESVYKQEIEDLQQLVTSLMHHSS